MVLANPAETRIVRHDETGLVGRSVDDCVQLTKTILGLPGARRRLSRAAARAAAARRPERSAAELVKIWTRLAEERRRARAA